MPFSILNIDIHGRPRLLWAPEQRISCNPSRGAWTGRQLELYYELLGQARHQMWVGLAKFA